MKKSLYYILVVGFLGFAMSNSLIAEEQPANELASGYEDSYNPDDANLNGDEMSQEDDVHAEQSGDMSGDGSQDQSQPTAGEDLPVITE